MFESVLPHLAGAKSSVSDVASSFLADWSAAARNAIRNTGNDLTDFAVRLSDKKLPPVAKDLLNGILESKNPEVDIKKILKQLNDREFLNGLNDQERLMVLGFRGSLENAKNSFVESSKHTDVATVMHHYKTGLTQIEKGYAELTGKKIDLVAQHPLLASAPKPVVKKNPPPSRRVAEPAVTAVTPQRPPTPPSSVSVMPETPVTASGRPVAKKRVTWAEPLAQDMPSSGVGQTVVEEFVGSPALVNKVPKPEPRSFKQNPGRSEGSQQARTPSGYDLNVSDKELDTFLSEEASRQILRGFDLGNSSAQTIADSLHSFITQSANPAQDTRLALEMLSQPSFMADLSAADTTTVVLLRKKLKGAQRLFEQGENKKALRQVDAVYKQLTGRSPKPKSSSIVPDSSQLSQQVLPASEQAELDALDAMIADFDAKTVKKEQGTVSGGKANPVATFPNLDRFPALVKSLHGNIASSPTPVDDISRALKELEKPEFLAGLTVQERLAIQGFSGHLENAKQAFAEIAKQPNVATADAASTISQYRAALTHIETGYAELIGQKSPGLTSASASSAQLRRIGVEPGRLSSKDILTSFEQQNSSVEDIIQFFGRSASPAKEIQRLLVSLPAGRSMESFSAVDTTRVVLMRRKLEAALKQAKNTEALEPLEQAVAADPQVQAAANQIRHAGLSGGTADVLEKSPFPDRSREATKAKTPGQGGVRSTTKPTQERRRAFAKQIHHDVSQADFLAEQDVQEYLASTRVAVSPSEVTQRSPQPPVVLKALSAQEQRAQAAALLQGQSPSPNGSGRAGHTSTPAEKHTLQERRQAILAVLRKRRDKARQIQGAVRQQTVRVVAEAKRLAASVKVLRKNE